METAEKRIGFDAIFIQIDQNSFCAHIIFILSLHKQKFINSMSQSANLQIQEHQVPTDLQQSEQKINPQTLIQENSQELDHKNVDNVEYEKDIQQTDEQTPKRNKSEQKSSISNENYGNHKHSLSLTHSPNNKNMHLKTSERIPEVEQEADQKNYEQLTMKLQLVLNKISSNNKSMNKSVSQSQNIIARFEQCEERKKKQIDKKKGQYQQQKIKQLKEKPTIDKNSEKISKEIGHKPIYLRVEALVQEKKKKIEKNEELRKKKLEDEESTYIEQYNKHVKKPDNVRTYDQYFSEMVRWKEKRMEENKQKLEIKKNKQLEGITFQPILNSKSKKMVMSHQRLPIEQRGLIKTKKMVIQPKIEEPKSFKKITTHQ